MTHKYLYDNEEQFYPVSEASAIIGGVVVQGNTVWLDLELIWEKARAAHIAASGGALVQGNLGIQVYYTNTTYNDKTLIQGEDVTWNDTMTIPDATAPYAWKKTVYSWEDNEIKKTYEICATALYPETQIMYCAIPGNTELGGPSNYGDDINDTSNRDVKWFTYFPGINANVTYGYMAVRHREAGKAWAENGGWKIALFAQYPSNSENNESGENNEGSESNENNESGE